MSKSKLAYVPTYKTEKGEFTPQLVRLIEGKETENGYYYHDIQDNTYYKDKKYVFVIDEEIKSQGRIAYDGCRKFIAENLSIKRPNITTGSIATSNLYVANFNNYSRSWFPILGTFISEKDGKITYKWSNKTEVVDKRFAVYIGDSGRYGKAYDECKDIVNNLCNDTKRCESCKYKNSLINLRCNSCEHAISVDGRTVCKLHRDKYGISLFMNTNESDNENSICGFYVPKEEEDKKNWHGYSSYLETMTNCYCNKECGQIRSHKISRNTFEEVFPSYVKLTAKTLFYKGRMVESIWVPIDKWVDGSFIDENKIYVSFIQFKKIKNIMCETGKLTAYINSIDYKPTLEAIGERLRFVKNLNQNEPFNLSFKEFCELEDKYGE